MSYNDDSYEPPYANIVFDLSPKGKKDALRRGDTVGDTETYVLEPDDADYQRVFDFQIATLSSDDRVVGVQLEIGRKRSLNISPSEAEFVDYFTPEDVEVSSWPLPTLETTYGDREPLDEYLTVSELLDYEAVLEENLKEQVLNAVNELAKVRAEWRSWVDGPGLEDARVLASIGEKALESAVTLQLKNLGTLRSELGKLRESIEAVESVGSSDDDRALLMGLVEPFILIVDDVRERVGRERNRLAQVSEATAWVIASGSSRLRKALQTGTLPQALGAYRDERLALERPGWTWWDREKNPVKPIINPSEADLDALIDARKLDPDANLGYMPDEGLVVTSRFLERPIYRETVTWESDDASYDEEPF
jgi:hypothetical protein